VREALKAYGRPEQLRASPLLTSRLARPADGQDPVVRLRQVLRAAVDAVGDQARGQAAAGAVDRTYLRPAATQELAAEVLGLPFGTYRRHLRAGVERVTALLWDWELHGAPDTEQQEVDSN
jgi:hypothetical protein